MNTFSDYIILYLFRSWLSYILSIFLSLLFLALFYSSLLHYLHFLSFFLLFFKHSFSIKWCIASSVCIAEQLNTVIHLLCVRFVLSAALEWGWPVKQVESWILWEDRREGLTHFSQEDVRCRKEGSDLESWSSDIWKNIALSGLVSRLVWYSHGEGDGQNTWCFTRYLFSSI